MNFKKNEWVHKMFLKFILLSVIIGNSTHASIETYLMSIDEIHECSQHLKKNEYSFGNNIVDCQKEVMQVDCSGLVDQLIKKTFPAFYQTLLIESKNRQPMVLNYYNLLLNQKAQISTSKNETSYFLKEREFVSGLKKGDLILWKYSDEYKKIHQTKSTGHIMIVLEAPEKEGTNLYKIKVLDSAKSGHAEDSRKEKQSGVGFGYIVLKTNEKGVPVAYAWKLPLIFQDKVEIKLATFLTE